jgi:exopolysaccharide biosynthesis polyprenyl glycosylphosphotransferase
VSVAPETRPHPAERSGYHPLSWLERRAAAFAGPRDQVGWLVLAGRVILIWLPVYFLFIQSLSLLQAVFATTVVTAVWTIGLRTALSAYFTLGPAVASAVGTITGLVAISALDLWIPDLDLRAAGLAEAAVAVFLLSAAWEHVVRSIAKRRVLVVGTGGCASDVLAELNNGHRTPFTMLGLVGERPEGTTAKVPRLGSFEELSEIVAEQKPDIVILTDEHVSSWAVDPLLDLAPAGFRVVGVSHFIEHALGRVPLRHLTPTWFMSMLHLRQKPYTRVAKRAFDLAIASLGLLLALPLLPVLALLVRLTPGPVIYRQTRVGEGGRHFTIFKFRTMREDAENEGAPRYAQVDDSRVTRVGRLLRQTHLDELPQLWNVVRGEMSIVGPRPERPEFVGLFEESVYRYSDRHRVKSGITGWAQVHGLRGKTSLSDRVEWDNYYIENWSLWLDLKVLLLTFLAVARSPQHVE